MHSVVTAARNMGPLRADPCVLPAMPVRLEWFVWVRRRGQGATRLGIASPPDADGRVSGRADSSHHLSEAKQSAGTAKRRDAEAREVSVKKTTVRLTVMASSLMALLLAGGAHWSRH